MRGHLLDYANANLMIATANIVTAIFLKLADGLPTHRGLFMVLAIASLALGWGYGALRYVMIWTGYA